MTREEKIKYLNDFCYTQDFCVDCILDGCLCSVKKGFNELDEEYLNAMILKVESFNRPSPSIKDSGDRSEFETGAVRDMREGKGRFDLTPLDIIADYLKDAVLENLYWFQKSGELRYLYSVLENNDVYSNDYTMFLEVAKHFEEGAKKYGENNWQKGIPVRCYIDSAVRHYLKWLRGDEDEPHGRAFCWNIICAIWTCIHKPELNEYGPKPGEDESDEKDST